MGLTTGNTTSPEVVHVTIDVNLAVSRPIEAFSELLRSIPGWDQITRPEITRISGAMTNLVFLAQNPSSTVVPSRVLIRVFGQEGILFIRGQERGIFLVASRLGLGPKCLVEFANGRVEEYIPGRSPSAKEIRTKHVAAAIAVALADFHATMYHAMPLIREASGPKGTSPDRTEDSGGENALWGRLSRWIAAAKRVAPEKCREFGLDGIEEEVDKIRSALSERLGPDYNFLAVCHNDLQQGNILLPSGAHATKVDARLIDFEYCAVGDIGFDIANHFCEYAADYHADGGYTLDWSLLPNDEEQGFFCRKYIEALVHRHAGGELVERIPMASSTIDGAVELLKARAAAYVTLSHLKWGLWGLIQCELSAVDFDFKGYAERRLQQYTATKMLLIDVPCS